MDEAGISTPRAVWERNNRGRALFELGRLEDAMHYYGEAVEICLEWNYSDTLPLSIEYFNEVLKIDPRNVEALVAKAATLGKLKRFREALKCYDLALSIDLNHAGAWAGKGACLVALGKPGEGKICLQRAFKLDPNLKERGEKISKTDIVQINIHRFFGEYAYELSKKALSLVELGRLDESIAILKQAIQLHPNNAVAHFNLGLAYCDKGWLDQAITELKRAIELDLKTLNFFFYLAMKP